SMPRPVHGVRVLEEDGLALLRDHRAPHEGAHRVHGHRAGTRRVSDVRLVEEDAGRDVVRAHRSLQSSESFRPEHLEPVGVRGIQYRAVVRRHAGSSGRYGGGGVIRTREGWIRPLTAFEAVPFVRSGTPPWRV